MLVIGMILILFVSLVMACMLLFRTSKDVTVLIMKIGPFTLEMWR